MSQAEALDCAIFAAAMVGSSTDKEMQAGAGYFLSWLVGRYEGVSGADIDDAMIRRGLELTQADLNRMQPACIKRMAAFGARMTKVGAAMMAAGKAQQK